MTDMATGWGAGYLDKAGDLLLAVRAVGMGSHALVLQRQQPPGGRQLHQDAAGRGVVKQVGAQRLGEGCLKKATGMTCSGRVGGVTGLHKPTARNCRCLQAHNAHFQGPACTDIMTVCHRASLTREHLTGVHALCTACPKQRAMLRSNKCLLSPAPLSSSQYLCRSGHA
jgi:hypothetical protein